MSLFVGSEALALTLVKLTMKQDLVSWRFRLSGSKNRDVTTTKVSGSQVRIYAGVWLRPAQKPREQSAVLVGEFGPLLSLHCSTDRQITGRSIMRSIWSPPSE